MNATAQRHPLTPAAAESAQPAAAELDFAALAQQTNGLTEFRRLMVISYLLGMASAVDPDLSLVAEHIASVAPATDRAES